MKALEYVRRQVDSVVAGDIATLKGVQGEKGLPF